MGAIKRYKFSIRTKISPKNIKVEQHFGFDIKVCQKTRYMLLNDITKALKPFTTNMTEFNPVEYYNTRFNRIHMNRGSDVQTISTYLANDKFFYAHNLSDAHLGYCPSHGDRYLGLYGATNKPGQNNSEGRYYHPFLFMRYILHIYPEKLPETVGWILENWYKPMSKYFVGRYFESFVESIANERELILEKKLKSLGWKSNRWKIHKNNYVKMNEILLISELLQQFTRLIDDSKAYFNNTPIMMREILSLMMYYDHHIRTYEPKKNIHQRWRRVKKFAEPLYKTVKNDFYGSKNGSRARYKDYPSYAPSKGLSGITNVSTLNQGHQLRVNPFAVFWNDFQA